MNKQRLHNIFKLLVTIAACGFSSLAAASTTNATTSPPLTKTQLNAADKATAAKEFSLAQKSRLQTEANIIRARQTYKRVYAICANGRHQDKFNYTLQAAQQVYSVPLSQAEAKKLISDVVNSDHFLSPMLSHDLQDEGFFAALQDCGLDESQQKYFILSLITMDYSGKLLGIVGLVTFMKYTAKTFRYFMRQAPFITGTLSTGSTAFAIYNFLYYTDEAVKAMPGAKVITNVADIDKNFDLRPIHQQKVDLARAALQLVEVDLAHAMECLTTTTTDGADQRRLQIADLEEKRAALLRILEQRN